VPATIDGYKAAEHIGISYGLLMKMVANNKVPCIHAGDRKLFRIETLDRWMEEQEKQSTVRTNAIRKVK
jgi:excisionase family DNA binding protein